MSAIPVVRRSIRAVADFARGENGFVAAAILSFVLGLGVGWSHAFNTRQENELGPCHRVVEVARFKGSRHETSGPILVVRIERALDQRSTELHPRGEATCNPANLNLPIPPIPNVLFRRRGGGFEPLVPPRRRTSPLFLIPFKKPDRLSESSSPKKPREAI